MSLVAIQGIKGSYSEEATSKFFGRNAEILECLNFEETFESVVSGKAQMAVVPLKNKIVGEIKKANELLAQTKLRILDEMPLAVKHVLVGTPKATLNNLKNVRSHEEAFRQCQKFLSQNAHLETFIGNDTASSIRRIVIEDNSEKAAIGSGRAAEIYGGKILMENIADDLENVTWFYVIGQN